MLGRFASAARRRRAPAEQALSPAQRFGATSRRCWLARQAGSRRRNNQRGSALLIVFVFAAIIAINLYMEMPVAVFESRRQKEQLLIDRGNEYAHAVKLFVRKTGQYPPSLDALENTNNMRFLRHRFTDPFTGKDDWRLLHAGPGGILLDSKSSHSAPLGALPTNTTNSTSNTASFGSSNSSFGSNNNNNTQQGFGSGFGSSSDSSSNSNSQPDVIVPPLPQRGPEMAVNGSGAPPADTASDPTQSLVPTQPSEQTGPDSATNTSTAQNSSAGTVPGQGSNPASGTGAANPSANGNPGLMQNMVSLQQPGASSAASTGGLGRIAGGGIAGVASKAGGHSIKLVNDEDDYSKWEFYYDPRKDINAALGQAGIPTPGVPTNGAPGLTPQSGTQNSPTQSIFANPPSTNTPTTNPSPQATTSSQQQ